MATTCIYDSSDMANTRLQHVTALGYNDMYIVYICIIILMYQIKIDSNYNSEFKELFLYRYIEI